MGNFGGRLEHFAAMNVDHTALALTRSRIAVAESVAHAEFHRIDLQCSGDHVHLRFAGKDKLNHSRGAEMATRNGIGVDRVGINLYVWDPIGTGGLDCAGQINRWNGLHRAVSAAVPKCLDLPCHQGTVLFHPGLHDHDRRMPRISSRELLGIGHDHTHRSSSALSEEVAQRQIHECSLAAEITADGGNVDHDFFSGHADGCRETLFSVVRNLVAYPYVNRACLPVDGDHA